MLKLQLARKILGYRVVDALMTTSSASLDHLQEVIGEYVRLGINGIFIRSLNPYGIAAVSDPIMQVHYVVREVAALVKEKLRGNI